MKNYIHIAQRVYNSPVMMEESKFQVILGIVAQRAGIEAIAFVPEVGAAADPKSKRLRTMPNSALKDNMPVRVIDVGGTLVNRYATGPSGVLTYDEISDYLRIAAADPTVQGILLRFDSWGGEAVGVADVADVIREVKAEKPVWASVDAHAFSAAFFLASQTDKIVITRDGGAGSVGVIAVHYDLSEANKKAGVKPTVISAGKRKADFSMDAPLSKEAAGWLQAEVDRSYEVFAQYVAEGRRMSPEAVKATEAGLYIGQDAIDIGFADEIGTFEHALEAFSAALSGAVAIPMNAGGRAAATSAQGDEMATPTAAGTPAADDKALDRTAIEATARLAERTRIKAILTHAEASGRDQLARHLALETDTTAEAAGPILAASPKAAAQSNNFAEHMKALGNPNVAPDAPPSANETTEDIKRVLAA